MSATVNSDLFLWGTRTTAGAKKHLWNPVKSLVHMESRLHGLQDNGAQGLKTSVVTLWVVARAQGSSAGEIPQLSSQPQVPVWAVDDARVLTLFWPAHPCTHMSMCALLHTHAHRRWGTDFSFLAFIFTIISCIYFQHCGLIPGPWALWHCICTQPSQTMTCCPASQLQTLVMTC